MAKKTPTSRILCLQKQWCAISPGYPDEIKAKHLNSNDLELEHIVNHSILCAVPETCPFVQAGS
jgi:hypothetical protein